MCELSTYNTNFYSVYNAQITHLRYSKYHTNYTPWKQYIMDK
jgi:hypothetical protein